MSAADQVRACTARDLRVLSRSPVAVVQSVAFPTLLLLTLLAAFGRSIGGSVADYSQRLVPQLVLSAGAFGAVGTGLAVYTDRTTGMLDRLRSMPVARSAYLTAAIVADAVRAVAAAAVLLLVGTVAGFRFEEGVAAAAGFVVLVTAFGTVWAWLAVALGLGAAQAESVGATMNGPVLMLFFLSTGFVPVEGYPGFVQPLVRLNPLSNAVDALVGLSSGGPVLAPVLRTAAWVAVLVAAFSTLARRRLRAT